MERAVQQRLDIALANEYQRQLKAIRALPPTKPFAVLFPTLRRLLGAPAALSPQAARAPHIPLAPPFPRAVCPPSPCARTDRDKRTFAPEVGLVGLTLTLTLTLSPSPSPSPSRSYPHQVATRRRGKKRSSVA